MKLLARQFRSYPLQSALIVVAVALGVGVVTAVAAFLEIGQRAEQQLSDSLWARRITVQAVEDDWQGLFDAPVRKLGAANSERVRLTLDDLPAARAAVPGAEYVYTEVAQFIDPGRSDLSTIINYGVTKDYLAAHDIETTQGTTFSDSDFEEKRNVALVTPSLIRRAGLPDNPVGRKFETYEIIGVLAEQAQDDPDPLVQPPDMLIPFPNRLNNPPNTFSFVVNDVQNLAETRAEVERYARETWGDGVVVRSNNPSALLARQRVTSLIIAALASVGLVIGALNIMNLMLARVVKASRAIGVRRSLGATRSAIFNETLADALALGVVGGVLGVVFGYGLLAFFNSYIQSTVPDQARLYLVSPSPLALVVGLLVALLTSTLFGVYPALRAARMNIVEVLKGTA